jgi:hypothetical protein
MGPNQTARAEFFLLRNWYFYRSLDGLLANGAARRGVFEAMLDISAAQSSFVQFPRSSRRLYGTTRAFWAVSCMGPLVPAFSGSSGSCGAWMGGGAAGAQGTASLRHVRLWRLGVLWQHNGFGYHLVGYHLVGGFAGRIS